MKRQSALANSVCSKTEGVHLSAPVGVVMAVKATAKRASKSAVSQSAGRIGRSPYAFVPADADIKVRRWPKL